MIYGVGIDLLDFAQVNLENEKFIQKVLTMKEANILLQKKTVEQRVAFFAGRFAAKEAFVKALGTGFRYIEFQHIEVLNDPLGKPEISFLMTGNVSQEALIKALTFHVSISHSLQAATAIVVLEKRGDELI